MIGITNAFQPKLKYAIDDHVLFYVNGNSLNDQSNYQSTCTFRTAGTVLLYNCSNGPFNNQECPVIYLQNGRIGWTNPSVYYTIPSAQGWTWEFWRYRLAINSSEDCFCIGNYQDGSANALHNDTSASYYSYLFRNGSNWSSSTAAPFQSNAWYHVAYVLVNNVLYLYLNGVLKTTYNNYGNINTSSGIMFGGYNATTLGTDGGNNGLNSYIAEARFSDIPRYTDNFTVPDKFLY